MYELHIFGCDKTLGPMQIIVGRVYWGLKV